MPQLHFQTPQNMFEVIRHFSLYNPVLKKYIWLNTEKSDGNDYDSIAVRENLTPYQAEKYATDSKEDGRQCSAAYFPPGDYTYQDKDMLDYLSELYMDPNWIIADENYKAPKEGVIIEIQELKNNKYTIEEIRHAQEVIRLLKTKPLAQTQGILKHTKPDALTPEEWYLLLIMSEL